MQLERIGVNIFNAHHLTYFSESIQVHTCVLNIRASKLILLNQTQVMGLNFIILSSYSWLGYRSMQVIIIGSCKLLKFFSAMVPMFLDFLKKTKIKNKKFNYFFWFSNKGWKETNSKTKIKTRNLKITSKVSNNLTRVATASPATAPEKGLIPSNRITDVE